MASSDRPDPSLGTGPPPPPDAAAAAAVDGLRELSDWECRALLAGHCMGRLAFAAGGRVLIFPVNYHYDGTDVVVRTAPGSKLAEAPLRPVAFEIDDADPAGAWAWSVVVHGPCFDVTEAVDRRSQQLRALPVYPWAPGDREHWLAVVVREVTGRAFGSANQPGTCS